MGISRGEFIKLERGERGLTERTIDLAARAFGVSRAEILHEGLMSAPRVGFPWSYSPFGAADLPVLAAAEAGPREMLIYSDPLAIVPRPWYLGSVKDGFAVRIVGESMEPAYEPGDFAIVNPRLPPTRDKDFIFVAGESEGQFTATIKRLIRWTDRDWYLKQFNPPKGMKSEFTLSRTEWPKALRVVGKYMGGI